VVRLRSNVKDDGFVKAKVANSPLVALKEASPGESVKETEVCAHPDGSEEKALSLKHEAGGALVTFPLQVTFTVLAPPPELAINSPL
jgi:hypothetical protein